MRSIHRIWITRAQPGASRTAARLSALGFEPLVAPLLEIRPLPDALNAAPDLSTVHALAFTSPNGVTAFAALMTGLTTALVTSLRDLPTFCVGDTTAEAARAAGFTDARSASGDIHDLADLIRRSATSDTILAPGAREPAGDLPDLLPEHVIYRLPVYAAHQTHIAAPEPFDAVMLHSPRAARALAMTITPDQARNTVAISISAAATAPLTALSFAEIRTAVRPDETSMISTLGKSARAV